MPDLLPFLICAAAYAAQAVIFWPGRVTSQRPGYWRLVPLVPLMLHIALLVGAFLGGDGVSLGFATMLSAIAALSVLVYGVASWRYSLGGMQGVVLAIAAVAVLLQGLIGGGQLIPHSENPAFRAHLLMSMTAYSLFLIAAVHAVFLAVAERALQRPAGKTAPVGMLPLLTIEALLFRLLEVGFAVLTLTLLTGIIFSKQTFGQHLPFTHMTVFGIASWIIFAALLLGRHRYGWRGQRAIYGTLVGFAMLFLSYMGAQFVLEILLGRV